MTSRQSSARLAQSRSVKKRGDVDARPVDHRGEISRPRPTVFCRGTRASERASIFAAMGKRKIDATIEVIGWALSAGALLVAIYFIALALTGRSELAAQLYDEILFNGATFGDLDRGDGPFVVAMATDIASGGRVPFNQNVFNVLCSDLNAIHLSRAAAASSAVPVVLSPVTINNYGGTCGNVIPPWAKTFIESANPPRPAARATRELRDIVPYRDSKQHPYIHLVDGGVSDNVAMRGVLDGLELLEALHDAGVPTPLDRVRRIVILVVNSLSSPPTTWDESESPPGTVDILLKATGVPIDHYSYEAVELLKDISARWDTLRRIRNLAGCSTNKDSPICAASTRPGSGDLRDRRVVRRAPRQGGARLPESTADVIRAAGRGCRSLARRGGHDHSGVARISAAAEGRRRDSHRRSVLQRCRGSYPLMLM